MTWPAYKQIGYIEPIRPKSRKGGESATDRRIQEAEARKTEEKQRTEIDTERRIEKLKSAKWTRDDLIKLLYEQEKILDNHFGDAQTFHDDVALIEAQIAKEKGEIKIDGIEKEKISADGIDYLYGLLIQEHIMKQNFYIEIDANYQPIIHDNQTNPDKARTQQKESLQKALSALEFQHDSNSVLRKNDNVSKVATYITAAAYHGQTEKNLIKYRETIEKKIQKNPNQPLTVDEIKKSNLTPNQKTFLLAWNDRKNDANLTKIEGNQQRFVEQARENFKKKSTDQHLQELGQRPLGKSIELFGAGVIGIGLLVFGLKQMFGEKSGVMGKIFGTILALIGGVMVLPMGDKAWQALGGPEMVNGLTTKRPIDRVRAADQPFAGTSETVKEQWEKLSTGVKNLQARTAGPKEWIGIVTRPEIQPATKDYPVGAMLYILYEGMPTEQGKYTNYKANEIESRAIKKTLDKLTTPGDKTTFRNLLEASWKRNMENHPELKTDIAKAKDLKLPTIIASLDTADSWLNYVPDWLGGEPKKVEVLKIIAPKAKEWGKISLERLHKYFIEGKTGPSNDEPLSKLISGDNEYAAIKSYIESFNIKDKNITLQEFLKVA